MLLQSRSQLHKVNYVLLVLLVITTLLGNVQTETGEEAPKNLTDVKKTPAGTAGEHKSFKKELKLNITDEAIEQVTVPKEPDDHTEKLVIIDEKSVIETSGKALVQQPDLKTDDTKPLQSPDDISDSLKTGFYFFLILSSGAILFIVFKIYRLRLSRAERKYGVQGDRSTQELTPLPISIEDGHSDDEDQTLFEVQRQNIRIL